MKVSADPAQQLQQITQKKTISSFYTVLINLLGINTRGGMLHAGLEKRFFKKTET